MSSVLDVPVQIALVMALAVSPEAAERTGTFAGGTPSPKRLELGFTDESWIAALYRHGTAAGAEHLGSRIFRTSSGRIYIPVADDRKAILGAKADPGLSVRVAVVLARANGASLKQRLGRQPTLAEIYMAHGLGLEPTVSLLIAAKQDPTKPAAEIVPRLALAHPALFFEKGKLRTAHGVVTAIEQAFSAASLRAAQTPAAVPKPQLARGHQAQVTVTATVR